MVTCRDGFTLITAIVDRGVTGRCYSVGERSSETLAASQFWRTCVNISLPLDDDVSPGPHTLSRDDDGGPGSPHTVLTVWNVSAVSRHRRPVSLVIYARRRLPPTHVRYDVRHTLRSAPTLTSAMTSTTSAVTSVTSAAAHALNSPQTARRRLPVYAPRRTFHEYKRLKSKKISK